MFVADRRPVQNVEQLGLQFEAMAFKFFSRLRWEFIPPQIHQTVSSRTPCRFGGGTLTSSMSSEVLEALVKGPGTEKQRSLETENLKVPPRSPLETVKKHPSTPKSSARLTKKPKPGEEKSTSDPPQGVLPPGQVLH